MIYQLNKIKEDVRISMGDMKSDDTFYVDEDELSMITDELIASKIEEGVRRVHSVTPYYKLDTGHHFGDSITWEERSRGKFIDYVALPEDFLRLVVFEMSDWDRAVYEVGIPMGEMYSKMRSRVRGIGGTPQKPAVVYGKRGDGRVLEIYSCDSDEATVSKGIYVPIPEIDKDGGVEIASDCYRGVVYTIGGLVMQARGDEERGVKMLEQAKEIIEI